MAGTTTEFAGFSGQRLDRKKQGLGGCDAWPQFLGAGRYHATRTVQRFRDPRYGTPVRPGTRQSHSFPRLFFRRWPQYRQKSSRWSGDLLLAENLVEESGRKERRRKERIRKRRPGKGAIAKHTTKRTRWRFGI